MLFSKVVDPTVHKPNHSFRTNPSVPISVYSDDTALSCVLWKVLQPKRCASSKFLPGESQHLMAV